MVTLKSFNLAISVLFAQLENIAKMVWSQESVQEVSIVTRVHSRKIKIKNYAQLVTIAPKELFILQYVQQELPLSREEPKMSLTARIVKKVSIALKVAHHSLFVPRDITAHWNNILRHALRRHIMQKELNQRLKIVQHVLLVISATVLVSPITWVLHALKDITVQQQILLHQLNVQLEHIIPISP